MVPEKFSSNCLTKSLPWLQAKAGGLLLGLAGKPDGGSLQLQMGADDDAGMRRAIMARNHKPGGEPAGTQQPCHHIIAAGMPGDDPKVTCQVQLQDPVNVIPHLWCLSECSDKARAEDQRTQVKGKIR